MSQISCKILRALGFPWFQWELPGVAFRFIAQSMHSRCWLLQPGTAMCRAVRYFSSEQCLFLWQRATQVLAKTPRKGKTLTFSPPVSRRWVTPLVSSCSAANWQLALSKIRLFLWWWKVMTSSLSKDSQKNEKPSWFLLPRAHCLYSPFSVLRQNTHFYPCLIRSCRGLQADGSLSGSRFL